MNLLLMKSLSVKVKGTLQRTLFVPFNSLLLFIIILFYLDYSNSQLQYFMQKKGSALFLQFTELSNTQSLLIYRVFNSEFYFYIFNIYTINIIPSFIKFYLFFFMLLVVLSWNYDRITKKLIICIKSSILLLLDSWQCWLKPSWRL